MNHFEKRIERLEQHESVQPERVKLIVYKTYYEQDLVPDVFDRPLTAWETYKGLTGDFVYLNVDPAAEAKARGGEIPTCPASRYEQWRRRQNELMGVEKSIDLMMFSSPFENKTAQNRTD